MDNIRITKNFYSDEFKVSKDYPELALKIEFTNEDIDMIKLHCEACLQPTRDKFGSLTILSGKRSNELNEKIGGTEDSDHLRLATDIVPNEADLYDVFLWMAINVPYRQLILYPLKKFIHVSMNYPGKVYKHEILIK